MKTLIAAIVMASSALLAGCAGTSASVKSEYRLAQGEKLKLQINSSPLVTPQGMTIFQERLTNQLSDSALLASPDDTSSKVIDITVTNYYMRHGATRALVGIMAGADNMQSTIQIKDPKAESVLSEFKVESKNPSAWGTSKGMIEEHADKIVETIKGTQR